MANFTLSQSPVDYSAQTTVLGADYSVHIAPMEFSSLLGNHGTIDCNLVPEAGTAPTATTDG